VIAIAGPGLMGLGIAHADDGDAASRLGLGFPGGGVLRWAEGLGLDEVVRVARQLAARHGDRFSPPAWLVERADNGRTLR